MLGLAQRPANYAHGGSLHGQVYYIKFILHLIAPWLRSSLELQRRQLTSIHPPTLLRRPSQYLQPSVFTSQMRVSFILVTIFAAMVAAAPAADIESKPLASGSPQP